MVRVAEMQNFDIIIVGGGLVGASAAVTLAQQDFRVCLIEATQPKTANINEAEWDSRIYAITPGNVNWLEQLGTWSRLDKSRICHIRKMEVWGDAGAEALHFDSGAANGDSLGVILESQLLEQALLGQLAELSVEIKAAATIERLRYLSDRVELDLDDGSALTAKLLVAADGGNSWVRQQSGIDVDLHKYAQCGVVANFETELPHQGIARQWFRDDGILAWLPMPGNRISMVWSTPKYQELTALSDEQLASCVTEAGLHVLGQLKTITSAAAFPLVKQTAHHLVKPRLVLVGDAAHRVHPLAGQGVNLGFRDVVELAKVLQQVNASGDIGDFYLLRQYERARKSDVLAMGFVTHGLQTLFESEQPSIKQLRNWGMKLVNRAEFIKKQLTKHAVI